jgi:uncharacterized protein YjbI with pentapeptide repeats
MVLKGVDEIDWFTDRPDRVEGTWKPQKLISQWESFFETSDPNAQASFKVGEERELITFEMFKPKYNNKKQRFSFKIDAGIINNRESDLVTGLKGKALDEVSLFIDDASVGNSSPDSWVEEAVKGMLGTPLSAEGWHLSGANLTDAPLPYRNLTEADLRGARLTGADLTGAVLEKADLTGADLTGAKLYGADLIEADLIAAELTDANLTYATLLGADLSAADLRGADLTFAYLAFADLANATMDGANLTNAIWDNTTCPDGTMNSGPEPCTAEQLNLA